MNDSRRGAFVAPSDSFWRRLGDTPLGDLLHGRITGAGNPRQLLAVSRLPAAVVDGIWDVARAQTIFPSRRVRPVEQMIAWSAQQLDAGGTVEDVIAELEERVVLARILRWKETATPLPVLLPPALRQALNQLIGRGLFRRVRMARAFYDKCVAELSSGVPQERLIERFGDVAEVALLLRRPGIRSFALESEIPVSLLRIVQEVVRATWLWPSERREVARELCAHFADGLASGRTAEELQESFGSVRIAAKLIGRAKRRNRSPLWQLWRRGWQAAGLTVLVATIFWVSMIARLHWARAPARVDFIGQIDQERSRIPFDDRAWPDYREALLRYTETAQGGTFAPLVEAQFAGPSHSSWPAVLEHLAKNEESLALTLRGTKRPEFGYVYREPANNRWLAKSRSRSVDELYPEQYAPGDVSLEHVGQLHTLIRLLAGAAHRSAAGENRRETTDYLEARLRLASQTFRSAEYTAIELTTTWWFLPGANAVSHFVCRQPQLFTDSDLVRLRTAVLEYGDGQFRMRPELLQDLVSKTLESLYSDDGRGNGRLTVRGIDDLRRMLATVSVRPRETDDWKMWLAAEDRTLPRASKWWEPFQTELASSMLVSVAADRRETLACAGKLMELLEQDRERPYWDNASSAFDAEVQRIAGSHELRQRFLPVLVVVPNLAAFIDRSRIMQLTAARDTALLAIALEQYRRQQGTFPERLEALVPEFLESVPIDPYDGKPIRYLRRDGRPLVWSVSMNKTDETAAMTTAAQERGASESDWQWLPPVEPTSE